MIQMPRKSKLLCLSPDVNDKAASIFLNHNGCGRTRVAGNTKRVIGIWILRVPKDSPVRFLQGLGEKAARAFRFVSMRWSSRKVSSSPSVRSRSLSDPTDSQRAEAVEDCIEFLHSSSSRQR
ncbi:Josephin-like protein [Quillaja saponaria]|uniref:Josephin-like protein n=1 Tax=Quillaja saponaria TaxID=32244 RepID=A0AAD7LN88_QUISA|nr:Josephin-like protein [Quillaja saponaria]